MNDTTRATAQDKFVLNEQKRLVRVNREIVDSTAKVAHAPDIRHLAIAIEVEMRCWQ